jgi:hypothetical protein
LIVLHTETGVILRLRVPQHRWLAG